MNNHYVNGGQNLFIDPYLMQFPLNPSPSHVVHPQLPMQQPVIQQPLVVYYPLNMPAVSPPLNQKEIIAYQAYHTFYQDDLKVLTALPSLNLDKTSIETLKQIEQRSNRGFVNGLLALMIKVLQVVGKLALGFVVGFSIALVISALLGLPAAAALVLLAIASHGLMTLILTGIGCKVGALVLQDIRQRRIEHSFCAAIQDKDAEVQNLKRWIQVKELSKMEGRIHDVVGKIQLAQQTAGYSLVRGQQILYLNSVIMSIQNFRGIEKELDLANSMILLNRYLANSLEVAESKT